MMHGLRRKLAGYARERVKHQTPSEREAILTKTDPAYRRRAERLVMEGIIDVQSSAR